MNLEEIKNEYKMFLEWVKNGKITKEILAYGKSLFPELSEQDIIRLIIINSLTVSRMLLSFTLPWVLESKGEKSFLASSVLLWTTDGIDGYLARKYKLSTTGGALMDTVADKSLSFIQLLLLSKNNKFLLVPLILEILIGIVNYLRTKLGEDVVTSPKGKRKTILLAVMIIMETVIQAFPELKRYKLLLSDYLVSIVQVLVILPTVEMQSEALYEYITKDYKYKEGTTSIKDEVKDWRKQKETLINILGRKGIETDLKQLIRNAFSVEDYKNHPNVNSLKMIFGAVGHRY